MEQNRHKFVDSSSSSSSSRIRRPSPMEKMARKGEGEDPGQQDQCALPPPSTSAAILPKQSHPPLPLHPSAPPLPPPSGPSSSSGSFLRRLRRRLLPLRQLLLLLLSLVAFQFVGAFLFLLCEAEAERKRQMEQEERMEQRRRQMVGRMIGVVVKQMRMMMGRNGSEMDGGGEGEQWKQSLEGPLLAELSAQNLCILLISGPTDQRTMRWDFWNAMLYAQSIFTTIGYGHLSTRTVPGRLLTLIYALLGIPLVLALLDDLGKLMTQFLLVPWILLKWIGRRIISKCRGLKGEEIRRMGEQDRRALRSSDLPLPLALLALFVWMSFGALCLCLWEDQWDLFSAFYFVFISLSTIGLGDLTPSSRPLHLLLLSAFLIIGLALVSMTVSLFQSKLYLLRDRLCSCASPACPCCPAPSRPPVPATLRPLPAPTLLRRNPRGSSALGVLSTNTSSSRASAVRERIRDRIWQNKGTQTVLSLPSPATNANSRMARAMAQQQRHWNWPNRTLFPGCRSLSIDDVMRLVDTEEGDIVLLTELTLSRDTTGLSGEETSGMEEEEENGTENRTTTTATSWSSTSTSASKGKGRREEEGRGVAGSKPGYFDHSNFVVPAHPLLSLSSLLGHFPTNLSTLELLEELEDRMVLMNHGGAGATMMVMRGGGEEQQQEGMSSSGRGRSTATGTGGGGGAVQFRSRLSLIPEHERGGEEQQRGQIAGRGENNNERDEEEEEDMDRQEKPGRGMSALMKGAKARWMMGGRGEAGGERREEVKEERKEE